MKGSMLRDLKSKQNLLKNKEINEWSFINKELIYMNKEQDIWIHMIRMRKEFTNALLMFLRQRICIWYYSIKNH